MGISSDDKRHCDVVRDREEEIAWMKMNSEDRRQSRKSAAILMIPRRSSAKRFFLASKSDRTLRILDGYSEMFVVVVSCGSSWKNLTSLVTAITADNTTPS